MSKLCESLQTLLFFSYFFVISQKKTRKINRFRPSNKKIQTTECHARNSDRICFNILYTELKMNQSPSPQFQNQSPPPSALCSFLKIGRIDKVVNKHTADYQLSYFYGLLSTLSLQSIFFLNLCILPWLQKIFKFIAIRLLQINFTNRVSSILVMPSSKTLPQDFIIIPQVREELPIPPKQHFLKISFPEREEREESYGVEKITKITKDICHKF